MPIETAKRIWRAAPTLVTIGLLWIPMTWVMDRTNPQEYLSGNIAPSVVRPGQTLDVHWNIIASRTCSITVTRHVVDSHNTVWDFIATPSASVQDRQTSVNLAREIKIPLAAAPGPAYYFSSLSFVCNPIHHFWPITGQTPQLHFVIDPI